MLSLSGHIGPKASALVDGQLSPEEEEQAWSHVLTCPGCRELVEREGWTKRTLGALSGSDEAPDGLPDRLLGSLYDVDVRRAWADVEVIERRSARRRTAAVLVGGSAVGACALALLTVAGPPVSGGGSPSRPSPATISGGAGGGVYVPAGTLRPFGAETTQLHALTRRSR
jgi:anti-sigma factor RsiW